MGKDFIGQRQNEIVFQCFHKHWIVFLLQVVQFIGFLAVTAGLLYWFYAMKQSNFLSGLAWDGFFVGVVFLLHVALHRLFLALFSHLMYMVIITNHRIILVNKSVLSQDQQDILDLSKIQDIMAEKKGVFQNIFHYGNIVITLSATNVSKVIKNVYHPNDMVHIIDAAKKYLILGKSDHDEGIEHLPAENP